MTRLLDPARLARLRQKQENAFTPIFLHRPLAILFLIPTADLPWITPNGITYVSILLRFVAAYLLWPAQYGGPEASTAGLVWAIVLWHLGSVLDAMDGALARYRGKGSGFGRYLDKVSDRVVSLSLVLAMALRVLARDQDPMGLVLGMLYISLSGTNSTAKWIEIGIRADARADAADPGEVPAPERSLLDWLKWGLYSLRTVFVMTEMDLPLWGSIAVATGKETWLFAYLGAFIVPYTLGNLVLRGYRIHRLDLEAKPEPQTVSE